MMKLNGILMALMLMLSSVYSHSDDNTASEIKHLLGFVEASTCIFIRNGSEYSGSEAAEHIQKKFDYVNDKGLIDTAEDFIKYAATKSSFSGKAYSVSCIGKKQMSSAQWLSSELARYRHDVKR